MGGRPNINILIFVSIKIQVLWLITSPVGDDDSSSPSHYEKELPDISFDLSADPTHAKISPAIINRGITVSGRAVF